VYHGESFVASTFRWIGAAVFTVLVPGTVTVFLPYYILDRSVSEIGTWGPLQLVAAAVLVVGAVIYFRCLWDFVLEGRGLPSPLDHPKRLVVGGLYRYVRNPMYVGVLLVLAGEVLLLRSMVLLWYALVWLGIAHVNILVYEERYLQFRFGDSYDAYRKKVRRWIPGRALSAARYRAPSLASDQLRRHPLQACRLHPC
jgi:protein-S-isoprenylcysteine O-methyltransferase Ste14